jgi:hypothetical protein
MKWILGEPKSGDMIRVKAGTIHHYGVFVSDSEVIQFGLAPNARPELKDSDIEVLATDIDTFLAGQFLEVAEFDRKEKKTHPTPEEAVAKARARMGEKGYHILYNNCEHFAYECVSGKHYSEQVDGVREMIKGLFGKK